MKEKQLKIIDDFKDQMRFCVIKDGQFGFHYFQTNYNVKVIFIPETYYQKVVDMEVLFDLLHEVGHIMTSNDNMLTCEKEYYATVWAYEHRKEYGIRVGEKIKEKYNKYIWDFCLSESKDLDDFVTLNKKLTFKW